MRVNRKLVVGCTLFVAMVTSSASPHNVPAERAAVTTLSRQPGRRTGRDVDMAATIARQPAHESESAAGTASGRIRSTDATGNDASRSAQQLQRTRRSYDDDDDVVTTGLRSRRRRRRGGRRTLTRRRAGASSRRRDVAMTADWWRRYVADDAKRERRRRLPGLEYIELVERTSAADEDSGRKTRLMMARQRKIRTTDWRLARRRLRDATVHSAVSEKVRTQNPDYIRLQQLAAQRLNVGTAGGPSVSFPAAAKTRLSQVIIAGMLVSSSSSRA